MCYVHRVYSDLSDNSSTRIRNKLFYNVNMSRINYAVPISSKISTHKIYAIDK